MKTTTLITLSLIGIMPIFFLIICMFILITMGTSGQDMSKLNYSFLLIISILAIFGFAFIMTLLIVQSREGKKLDNLDESIEMYYKARAEMKRLENMYLNKLKELNS